MKPLFSIIFFVALSGSLNAQEIYRIEIGKDYSRYSHEELRRRVWELERAVWQLQERVFKLELAKGENSADTWACTIEGLGGTFTATGATKAVASSKVISSCTNSNKGDGFFCRQPKCER